jgi:hypothetical protein
MNLARRENALQVVMVVQRNPDLLQVIGALHTARGFAVTVATSASCVE